MFIVEIQTMLRAVRVGMRAVQAITFSNVICQELRTLLPPSWTNEARRHDPGMIILPATNKVCPFQGAYEAVLKSLLDLFE